MKKESPHQLIIFKSKYKTPEFYGQEELKKEEVERAKKIMLDVWGIKGGNLTPLATKQDFQIYPDKAKLWKKLSKKITSLQDATQSAIHSCILFNEDEARGFSIILKKSKKPKLSLTLESYSNQVILQPDMKYVLADEVKLRVSALVDSQQLTSSKIKELGLNQFKKKDLVSSGPQPRLRLNINNQPLEVNFENLPLYIGNNPESDPKVEYFKKVKAKDDIVAKIYYLPSKCWILQTKGSKVNVVVEDQKDFYIANSVKMIFKNLDEDKKEVFYLERKK